MATMPEQMFRLTDLLMKAAEGLKTVFVDIAGEKERNAETGKAVFAIHDIEKRFESPHPLSSESLLVEEEFKFRGATAVKVATREDIDIPGEAKCHVTIRDTPKEACKSIVSAKAPSFRGTFAGSQVKVVAKIEASDSKSGGSYKGYCLIIRPKV